MFPKCGEYRQTQKVNVIGSIVRCSVRAQSGISEWNFRIDFNDYGRLTGNYWMTAENDDSAIPKRVAERIKNEIIDLQYRVETDGEEELNEDSNNYGTFSGDRCPDCGRPILNMGAKFCAYCGMRLYDNYL